MNVEADDDAEWGKNGEDDPNLWTDWKDSQGDDQDVPFHLFDDWNPEPVQTSDDDDTMVGDLFDDWNPDEMQTADDEAMVGDQSQMMTCGERVDVDGDHRGAVLGSNNGSVGGLPREKQVLRRTVRNKDKSFGLSEKCINHSNPL